MIDFKFLERHFTDNQRGSKYISSTPFKLGNHIYATNGYIVIRFPLNQVSNIPDNVTTREYTDTDQTKAMVDYFIVSDDPNTTYPVSFNDNLANITSASCKDCKGTGIENNVCECCDGEGKVYVDVECECCNKKWEVRVECHNCEGTGYTDCHARTGQEENCPVCEGDGKLQSIQMNSEHFIPHRTIQKLRLLDSVMLQEKDPFDGAICNFIFKNESGSCGQGAFMMRKKS